MRSGRLILSGFITTCWLLCATGCVCVDHRGAGPYGAAGCNTCDSGCDTGCDSGCNSCDANAGFGPGPLARLFGHAGNCGSCGGGGCGELYFDEWVNERPVVDNCGCGECLTCGHQPVRSLLRLLWGDRFVGGCDTCNSCDEGGHINFAGPNIYDGYDQNAWRANRGCNCGGSSVVHHEPNVVEEFEETPSIIQPKSHSPAPAPAANMKAPGATSKSTPTPAPPIPKSAMRLNPATRKVVR